MGQAFMRRFSLDVGHAGRSLVPESLWSNVEVEQPRSGGLFVVPEGRISGTQSVGNGPVRSRRRIMRVQFRGVDLEGWLCSVPDSGAAAVRAQEIEATSFAIKNMD